MAQKNKIKKCVNCKYFSGECTHGSNLGLKVQYRQEYTYFIKKPQELNFNGKCKNFEGINE